VVFWGRKKKSIDDIKRAFSTEDNLKRAITVTMSAVYADGSAEKAEIEAGHTLIMRMFGDKYDSRVIEKSLKDTQDLFEEGPISGRRSCIQACREVETDDERDALFSLAADVCGKAGGIGEAEDKWLREWLAPKLGVKAEDFLG
jgi:uncharacterized tellurite resistance protein B-like protein